MSDGSRIDPFNVARELGVDVTLPGPTELQIDIDDQASLEAYNEMFPYVLQLLPHLKEVRRTTSRSGNTHIYLDTREEAPLTAERRILLQALLGSDRKREFFSLLRVVQPVAECPPTLLFEVRPPAGTLYGQPVGVEEP